MPRRCAGDCWTSSVRRYANRVLDFLTSEPLRIRSFLRLVMIVLIALLITQTHVAHWREDVFTGVLVAYAIGSVIWLILLLLAPRPFAWH